jgi:hypothetical protein
MFGLHPDIFQDIAEGFLLAAGARRRLAVCFTSKLETTFDL